MHIKRLAAVVAAGLVLAAALPTFADAAENFKDVIVRNTDAEPVPTKDVERPFTVFARVETDECTELALPPGQLLIEHVEGFFVIPADPFLTIPATILSPTGSGQVGFTSALVPLEAETWLVDTENIRVSLDSAIRVEDGAPTVAGKLFRSAASPIELCAPDGQDDRGSSGPAVISGRLLTS